MSRTNFGELTEAAATTQGSRAWRWLVPALLLFLFANGRHPIPLATWLAPFLFLGFSRRRVRGGLWVGWLGLTGVWAFQFRGMAPLPPIGFALLAATFGLLLLLPFWADRLLAHRFQGLQQSLVLPTAWVLMEYLVATFTPYGSWGALAYSQHENLSLIQVVSITGIYGIGFLILWTASVAHSVGTGFTRPLGREVKLFLGVFSAVLLYGSLRLVLVPPQAPAVRIASLSKSDIELIPDPEVATRVMLGAATEEDVTGIRDRGNQINDDLLARSAREARAGAKIVFWGEANGFVFKSDEQELVDRASQLARAEGVYLGLGLGVWNEARDKPLENKLTLINPEGQVVWESYKAIPIPGSEAAISALDDGLLKTVDTPYGRVSSVVCFDMDFPGLLQQAGSAGVDLLLVPSNDWREIDPWHSHMARFRAIEQGFNLVRHVSLGYSIATDYQGRILGSMDHYTATDRVLLAQVPTEGVRTIYSRIGDSFAWLCGLIFLSLTLRGVLKEPTS